MFETCHELHGRAESLWASKRYGKVFELLLSASPVLFHSVPTSCTSSPLTVKPSAMPLEALCATDFGSKEIDLSGASPSLEETAPDKAMARGASSFDDNWLRATSPTFGYWFMREPMQFH